MQMLQKYKPFSSCGREFSGRRTGGKQVLRQQHEEEESLRKPQESLCSLLDKEHATA